MPSGPAFVFPFAPYQNSKLAAKRRLLPLFKVLVIAPKLESTSILSGAANCGVLKRLMDSPRMVSGFSFHTGNRRDTDALTLRMAPFRNTLRPRFPAVIPGMMYARAEAGSNCLDVSGLPMVRPRTARLTSMGRSQGVPSALPYPGASEPEYTENGVPLLSNPMVEIFQPPARARTQRLAEASEGVSYETRARNDCG